MSAQPELFTVRSMWEGTLLNQTRHLDAEAADECFDQTEKFYLNAPFSDSAIGVTVQMFSESDDYVTREVTFS